MTSSTSPTSSGSSADVGSSNSTSFGRRARARAIATRCCCPPDNRRGYSSALSAQPDPAQQLRGRAPATSARALPCAEIGASTTFSSTVRWPNRLKLWNTNPMCVRWRRMCRSDSSCSRLPDPPVADQLAVDAHEPAVDLLQVVDRAQQGRLAGPGRAEQHRHLAGAHGQVDAPQHLERAEALVHATQVDHRRAGSAVAIRPEAGAHAGPRLAQAAANPVRTARDPNRCSGVGGTARSAPRA